MATTGRSKPGADPVHGARDNATARERAERRSGSSMLAVGAGIALIIAVLYVGRGVLIPLAIAILLSFLLSPLVTRLQRLHVPRVPSVLLTTVFAFAVLGSIALLIGVQGAQLAADLPSYQANIVMKLRSLSDTAPGGGVLDRLSSMIEILRAEMEAVTNDTPAPVDDDVPVVQVREPPPSAFEVIAQYAAPLLGPVGKAGLVVVLVIFILLEREDLRNRLIRLLGPNINVTTEALDETGYRVSRYLLMQLVVNVTYGIPFGIGLYFIGIPNAFLWAALAVLLRFIPYLGPVLSAAFPLLLATAVDPGWMTLLLALGWILTLELISNNFVEPWLYGASTSISAVAIILAAIFWTTLWGPIGLLLATPLTVCLAVTGRYFPRLAFLDVLLGSAPALSLPERFYQRLLAGDADENVAIAEEYLEEHDLDELYDEVTLPALRLAAGDNVRGALTPERRVVVMRAALELVAELADHEKSTDEKAASEAAADQDQDQDQDQEAESGQRPSILCAAGRSALDLAAVGMLSQLLERRGYATRVVNADALAPEHLPNFSLEDYDVICISYLEETAVPRAQQTVRRLARRVPDTPVLLGLWSVPDERRKRVTRLPSQARAVGSLREALEAVIEATAPGGGEHTPAPIPENEAERLRDVHNLRGLQPSDERLESFTRRLSEAFGVPIALLNIIDEDSQRFSGQTGLPDELAHAGKSPRESSVCGHVVAANDPLIVEDALQDPRFAKNPFLLEHGIRFYAGVPLRSQRGHAVGSLCVIDAMPRRVTDEEKALLQSIAEEAMVELDTIAAGAAEQPDDADPPPDDAAKAADDAARYNASL